MNQSQFPRAKFTYIDDSCLDKKQKFSKRIENVFLSILDILKTTNGVDKFLRFFQYFSYIKQFKLKLLLKNKNVQSKFIDRNIKIR